MNSRLFPEPLFITVTLHQTLNVLPIYDSNSHHHLVNRSFFCQK